MILMMLRLFPFPCGHVVDAETTPAIGDYVECSWCKTSFLVSELNEWFASRGIFEHFVERPPNPLIIVDGALMEAMGNCRCGALLARKRHPEAKRVHLDVDPNTIQLLRN
jgi:hypothetical protein